MTAKKGHDKESSPTQRLKALLRWQAGRLRLARSLAIIGGVAIVMQHALLAHLFGQWLSTAGAIETHVLWALLPWWLGVMLIRLLLRQGAAYLALQASLNIRQRLRGQLLAALETLGPRRNAFGSDGSLSSQILEQVDAMDGYFSRYVIQQQLVVVVPLLVVAAVFYFSPLAAMLLLLTAPLVPVFMILLGNAAANKNRQQLDSLNRLSGQFLDFLRGLPTLQRLNAISQAEHWVECSARNYASRSMGVLRLAFLSTAVLELFASLSIALVALYLGLGLLGVLPWAKGEIPVAYTGALFILLLAPEFYQPLRQLGADYHDKARAEAAIDALSPLLDVAIAKHHSGQEVFLSHAPSLMIQNLAIYAQARQRLAPVSFTIASGERIQLSGESGVGKSSVLQALLGFVDYQGSIRVNTYDLQTLDLPCWRAQVAYLAQHPPILAMSIAGNLRLAAPQASETQLIDALEQVGLWSVIAPLPAALETPLGERGLGLSGGQLQRLAFAQLLLREPQCWLLDEPTAHLDPDQAESLMQLIEKITRGKTVILISHREAHLAWLDRRIVLFSEPYDE